MWPTMRISLHYIRVSEYSRSNISTDIDTSGLDIYNNSLLTSPSDTNGACKRSTLPL